MLDVRCRWTLPRCSSIRSLCHEWTIVMAFSRASRTDNVIVYSLYSTLRLDFRNFDKFRDHVTPLLRDKLHWLKFCQRIQYKLCLMVYKLLITLLQHTVSNSFNHLLALGLQEIFDLLTRCVLNSTAKRSSGTEVSLLWNPQRGTVFQPVYELLHQ